MKTADRPFTIDFNGNSLKVTRHRLGTAFVFHIEFPFQRQPLIIAKAKGEDIGDFWTSVPEGRQNEADQIGPLITRYLSTDNLEEIGGNQYVLL